jgi:cytochrome c551/c552
VFKTSFLRHAMGATALLSTTMLYAISVSAKPMHMMPPKVAAASLSQGMALASQYGCNKCHGANFEGRPGFSPSIRKTGALHDYSKAQFITLMHTGIQNDGKHVHRPMPVYAKMPTPQAVSIFVYLTSLK